MSFKEELTSALNRACAENRSNTPDFILARFLIGCLNAFEVATNERRDWYDPKIRAGAACAICKGTGSAITGNSFTPCPNCSELETLPRPCMDCAGQRSTDGILIHENGCSFLNR